MLDKLKGMLEDLNKKNEDLIDRHKRRTEDRKQIDEELSNIEKESIFLQGSMNVINELGTKLFEEQQAAEEAQAQATVPAEQVIIES